MSRPAIEDSRQNHGSRGLSTALSKGFEMFWKDGLIQTLIKLRLMSATPFAIRPRSFDG